VEAKCATAVEQRPPSLTSRRATGGGTVPPSTATSSRSNPMTAGMDLGVAMTSSSTATIGVSAGPRSGPDGPRSGLNCFFFIFKNLFFVSVGND
jgi:hypothetical protein